MTFHEIIHTKKTCQATVFGRNFISKETFRNHYGSDLVTNLQITSSLSVAKELRVKILRCALYQPDKVRQSLGGKHEEPIDKFCPNIHHIYVMYPKKRDYLICVYLYKPKYIYIYYTSLLCRLNKNRIASYAIFCT